MSNELPYFTYGMVVKGFGRGSKQLGVPTANYPQQLVDQLPGGLQNGVYYGWARVDDGNVHKMVVSIGWNPFYKNEKRSMETHVINEFEEDFYGAILKTMTVGYIRDQKDFTHVDELISEIKNDISQSKKLLDQPENIILKNHNFFTTCTTTSKQI